MIENRNLYDIYIEPTSERTITLNTTNQIFDPTFLTNKELQVLSYIHQDLACETMNLYTSYQPADTEIIKEIYTLEGMTKPTDLNINVGMNSLLKLYFCYGGRYDEIFDRPTSGEYYELLANNIYRDSPILKEILNGKILTDNDFTTTSRTVLGIPMEFVGIYQDCPYLKNFGNQVTLYYKDPISIGEYDNVVLYYYDYDEPDLSLNLTGDISVQQYISNQNLLKINANDFSLTSSRENLNKDNHSKRLTDIIQVNNTRELSFSYYIQNNDDTILGDYLSKQGIYQNDTEFRIIRLSENTSKIEIYEGCRYINDPQFSEQIDGNQLAYTIQYQKRIRASLTNPLSELEID